MIWDEHFNIGDGVKTTDEDAMPVYRGYDECGITMTRDLFREIVEHYNIYEETTLLKDIQFTPRVSPVQTTTKYYFLRLDVKFPRNS